MKKTLRLLTRIIIINFIFFFIVIYFLNSQAPLSKTLLTIPTVSPVPSATATNVTSVPSNLNSPTPANLSSQLSLHNNIDSCWFIIDGKLYDVTSYFGSHPGGDGELLKYCGTDASNGFHTKDKSSGVDHSMSAKAMLQQYLIQ